MINIKLNPKIPFCLDGLQKFANRKAPERNIWTIKIYQYDDGDFMIELYSEKETAKVFRYTLSDKREIYSYEEQKNIKGGTCDVIKYEQLL